jgi:hypothetical protein
MNWPAFGGLPTQRTRFTQTCLQGLAQMRPTR